jgi:hypothetical protein
MRTQARGEGLLPLIEDFTFKVDRGSAGCFHKAGTPIRGVWRLFMVNIRGHTFFFFYTVMVAILASISPVCLEPVISKTHTEFFYLVRRVG